MGRSFNTEKAYGICSALLLTWCSERGIDWKRITLLDLARFLRWLVDEPLPPRSPRVSSPPRFRMEKSANAVMTGVNKPALIWDSKSNSSATTTWSTA
ncbi:hypothetical protein [Streptomyces sp. NBC_00872]|uniref:hypothetical protein n=1 Tax=Streptomyces sp. NBC_00872 TaxID=2903686 RepID=UPI00386B2C06|nr:hypothetical protein OG214_38395 [Streptomyces sp. NBC_00872]